MVDNQETYKLWVCRNKAGNANLSLKKPKRSVRHNRWVGMGYFGFMDVGWVKDFFPSLKWEDEPVELEIRVPTSTEE